MLVWFPDRCEHACAQQATQNNDNAHTTPRPRSLCPSLALLSQCLLPTRSLSSSRQWSRCACSALDDCPCPAAARRKVLRRQVLPRGLELFRSTAAKKSVAARRAPRSQLRLGHAAARGHRHREEWIVGRKFFRCISHSMSSLHGPRKLFFPSDRWGFPFSATRPIFRKENFHCC